MLYIFLDESGNFDFSGSYGRQYYIITGLSVLRPFPCFEELLEYRYDLWEKGVEIEYFHASNNPPYIRDRVFNIICGHLSEFRADSIILEKCKTNTTLRNDRGRFYKKFLDILLKFILQGHAWRNSKSIIIIHDWLAVEQNRNILMDTIKLAVAKWAKEINAQYSMYFYQSKASLLLQVVDYINLTYSTGREIKNDRPDYLSGATRANFIRAER